MDNVIFDAEEKQLMLSNGYYSPFSRRIIDDYEKLRMCSIDLFQLVLIKNINTCEIKEKANEYYEFIKSVYPNNRKYLKGKDYIGEAIANSYALLNVLANKVYKFNYEEYNISDRISIDDIKIDNENDKVSFFVNYAKTEATGMKRVLVCPLHLYVTINFRNIYKYDTIKEEYRTEYLMNELGEIVHKKGYITYELCVETGLSLDPKKSEIVNEYFKQWFETNNVDICRGISKDIEDGVDRLTMLMLSVLGHTTKSDFKENRSIKCTNCVFNSSTSNDCDPLFIPKDTVITDEICETLKDKFKYHIEEGNPNVCVFKLNNSNDEEFFDIIISPKQKSFIKDAFEKQLDYIEIISNSGEVYTDDNKGILK